MPFDTAFALDDDTRGGLCIVFGNFERTPDQQFDWIAWSFPEATS